MKKLFAIFLILLLLTGCVPADTAGTESTQAQGGTLQVHFLDVGQADCALLEYEGHFVLIDGGNKEDGSLVVSYLEQQGVQELAAVFCTHAHEDHVGGLPAVLAVYPTQGVYAPTRTYSSNIFDDFLYYTDQQGLQVTIPAPGDKLTVNNGLTLTVLGPTRSYADPNNTSLVLLAEFGESRFLFTGDMETQAETDMLDHWGEGMDWSADVLKIGHHGSETSTGYRFLREVMPVHAVISVGEDNSYGHPSQQTLSRLSDAGCILYRTDQLGTVIAASDGSQITFTWNRQNAQPDAAEPTGGISDSYIGNKNSKKFHLHTCSSLPKEENRVPFDSYQEAIDAGYTPCGSCLG